jgi:hypothetical protein
LAFAAVGSRGPIELLGPAALIVPGREPRQYPPVSYCGQVRSASCDLLVDRTPTHGERRCATPPRLTFATSDTLLTGQQFPSRPKGGKLIPQPRRFGR